MKINFSNSCFGATIPNTHASKELTRLLNLSKDYDCESYHTDYDNLCKNINKILPFENDKVTFKTCNNKYGSSYMVEGEIQRSYGEKSSFSALVYYRFGSNNICKTITDAIQKVVEDID